MQSPAAQLAEIACFCQEEGSAGKEKVRCSFNHSIGIIFSFDVLVRETLSFLRVSLA